MTGTITSYNGSTQIWNINDNLVNTSDLVALEVQVLEAKKTPLTTQQTSLNNEQTAYKGFQQSFSSFVTFMKNMSSFKGIDKSTSVSQDGYVTATASADAISGTYSVGVKQLATRHQISGNSITLSDAVSSTATTIQINGKDVNITAGMTYQQLMNTVNADSSYGATMYTVGGRLFMSSAQTGAAGAITLTDDSTGVLSTKLGLLDSTGTFTNEITKAQDAQYYINDTNHQYMLTSSSNTIDSAIPGVTLKLENTTSSDVTITVEDAAADASISEIQSMVNSFNTAASTLATYTAEGTIMQGSSIALATSRAMSNMAMFHLNGQYLSQYGIQIDKTGQLSVDTTKLTEAFKNDPDAAKAFFFGTNGIAKTMDTALSTIFGDTGSLTTKIQSNTNQLSEISTKLSAIDTENQTKQEAIVAKYAAFEQQMSALNSQLAAIKAMTKSNSSSDS